MDSVIEAAAKTITRFEAAGEAAGSADKVKNARAATSAVRLNMEKPPIFINPSSSKIMQRGFNNGNYNGVGGLMQ
jgi:hypothetical protein